jgi:HAMP domain-containing protein
MRLEIKNIAEINAMDLSGLIDGVITSVQITAEALGKIDGFAMENPREHAGNILTSMLVNTSIYNAWFAFEPDAFDGRDEYHTDDYPGAPSGRFIRSYVAENGRVIIAPDMDEWSIDNPAISYWYTVPRDENRLLVNMTSDSDNLWDYAVGHDAVFALGVSAPVRNKYGQVIGCVGADVLFDEMIMGLENHASAYVAVFFPDGNLFYAPDFSYDAENAHISHFESAEQIQKSFYQDEALFLLNEYSPFAKTEAYTYFQPILTKNYLDSHLFMYAAMPRSVSLQILIPMLGIIAAIAFTVLLALFIMLSYLKKSIYRPINKLILAAEAISQGNIETEIGYFPGNNEISLLSRSLHRLVERFRMYIMNMTQSQEKAAISGQLNNLVKDTRHISEMGGLLCGFVRQYFRIYKTTLVLLQDGQALAYVNSAMEEPYIYSFRHFAQVEELIKTRKIAFVNQYTIQTTGISCLNPESVSACFIPLKRNAFLGYIIIENNDPRIIINTNEEANILYMSQIISELLALKNEMTDELIDERR